MAAPRLVVELTIGGEDVTTLMAIARSRTEPASRVERARMLLAYRDEPSFFAVGRLLGVHHQTVQRCIERAAALGPLAALDDSARPGKMATITPEAKAWLVSLACQKAKDFGYPHELWTTRLLARHAREHGPAAGHECLAKLVQGTVCKILDAHAVKPHRIRYYLERRDPEFEEKMAHVLCIYREVEILKEANVPSDAVAIISYDEKPGMQAIGSTAPDLPPKPGVHAAFARDHEYKRHGTLSLLAGIDLVTGKVHALVKDHRALPPHHNRNAPAVVLRPQARRGSRRRRRDMGGLMCTSRSFHYLRPYCTDFGTGMGASHPGSAPAVQTPRAITMDRFFSSNSAASACAPLHTRSLHRSQRRRGA